MSGPAKSVRLPFEPLERWLLTYLDESRLRYSEFGVERTSGAIADLVDCSPATPSRWRADGIPVETVDRILIDLDWHPVLVYGDEWIHALVDDVWELYAS